MKRLLSFILAMALCCPVFAAFASAKEDVLTGQCGDNLNYTIDLKRGLATISGTGAMWDYQMGGTPCDTAEPIPDDHGWSPFCYDSNAGIREIVVEEGVTAIGDCAFMGQLGGNSDLQKVTIASTVTHIGDLAFFGCGKLETVFFFGAAPTFEEVETLLETGAVIYHMEHTDGWEEPKWDGYPVEIFSGIPFVDIQTADWAFEGIACAYRNGLMGGVSLTEFAPKASMTRGMLVTVLYRQEGEPEAAQAVGFADVPAGVYYSAPIAWASQEGIVNGMEAERFCPEESITREQLVTILYRYAQKKGYDLSGYDDLRSYPDFGSVSGYASAAMQWAVGAELIKGTDGCLDSQGSATRAQGATVLMRFLKNIAE